MLKIKGQPDQKMYLKPISLLFKEQGASHFEERREENV